MDIVSLRSADEGRLRRALTDLAATLRTTTSEQHPPTPRYIEYDNHRRSDGTLVGRKKVILMSGGCSVPTCTMCPFTNENNYGHGRDHPSLIDQVETVLTRSPDEPAYDLLALYNDGSFFAPAEVPHDVQMAVAERVAASGVHRLVVESLPQFVRSATLAPFVEALGTVELEVGIGLQSADDFVRETLVNTRITRRSFERALATMAELGVQPKVYLMIKPPFLTDEEAVTDVVESVEYVRSLGVDGVTLCPTRVSRNTVAWWLYENGSYQPPNLWTVAETVRRAHQRTAVRVACINLRGSDFESIFPASCPACADEIVDGLVRYSETGDLADLPESCGCRPVIEPAPLDHRTIAARSLALVAALDDRP